MLAVGIQNILKISPEAKKKAAQKPAIARTLSGNVFDLMWLMLFASNAMAAIISATFPINDNGIAPCHRILRNHNAVEIKNAAIDPKPKMMRFIYSFLKVN